MDDIAGILARAERFPLKTLRPASLSMLSELESEDIGSFVRMYGYEASSEVIGRIRDDISNISNSISSYSIPSQEQREWRGIIEQFSTYTTTRRWSLSNRASMVFANIVAEEIHAAVVGRAESPLRSHIIGLVSRGIGPFQPTVSLLKRMGATLVSDLRTLPVWLADKLRAYEVAKKDYVLRVIRSDTEMRQWMSPALLFLFALALGLAPLTAAIPTILAETTLILADGARIPRAAVREALRRFPLHHFRQPPGK